MYTNADITAYLYSKVGKKEEYTRTPIEGVFWDNVKQSNILKTGQVDTDSVLIVIPWESPSEPISFTTGRDLIVKGIVPDEIDSSSQEAISKSMEALKKSRQFVTVTTADEKLYGSEEMWHYELSCK